MIKKVFQYRIELNNSVGKFNTYYISKSKLYAYLTYYCLWFIFAPINRLTLWEDFEGTSFDMIFSKKVKG